MSDNCEKSIEFFKKYGVLILLFLIFLLALVFYYYYVSLGWWNFSELSSDWANFGSYSAGIFTGITFLGVLYQIYLTAKYQAKQDFERVFFMLLEQHNAQINHLDNKNIINDLYKYLTEEVKYSRLDDIKVNLNFGEKSSKYSDLNAYFLVLYRILKFLSNNVKYNCNNQYSSILRSFISRKLLFLLSFHLCINLDDKQYKSYREYINSFSFLEHMDLLAVEADFINGYLAQGKPSLEDIYENIARVVNGYSKTKNFSRQFEGILNKRKNREFMIEGYEKAEFILSKRKYFFIYLLSVFSEKAFKGNPYYRDMMITYQSYISKMKKDLNIQELK
ncbi:hypothetical protein F480_03910 [Bibersteinia trehalosi Y31]|uniref:Phage abortive infection protein n=1 Tax=Bibersteinia trehalosi Y31 TaxID=1261658 RepID=A0A179D1Z3_BIBTR|nr:putative phage abortive infection protein [Bibersteinia trehalosi]OAQ15828.1 hypothetical protein F480_03910 [Bibersteinia trehalosi Y31]